MSPSEPAKASISRHRWPYALIWILPVLIAVLTFLYLRDYLAQHGPKIVIKFADASDIVPGQTHLLYRGSDIGRVVSVTLSEDRRHSLVTAELQKREDIFATKGASFWIVRPEFSQMNFSGLDTLMTGAYIHASPGKGDEDVEEFEGLTHQPLPYEEGSRFVLTTSRLGHIQEGSPLLYKGIQVGSVRQHDLADDASSVEIQAVIWTRYAHLLRENSKFWVSGGFEFSGGIFSGVHLSLESLQSLASGAISFASPEKDLKPAAKPGAHFALEDHAQKEWEKWSPRIPVPAVNK
jgi:paraquat-inducible protein B